MGIFANKKATESLAFRLGELTIEVRELKTAHKHLELEWEELYDKVRHQMSRMSRRVKADQKDNGELAEETPDNGDLISVDPISEQILARRNRGFIDK